MQRKKWIVIGAGPAGLATTLELANSGEFVQLFEDREFLGGASATLKDGEFRFDFGPHAYHIKGTEVDKIVEQYVNQKLSPKTISQKLWLDNKLLSFPLKFYELIKSIHPLYAARIIFDFIIAQIVYFIVRYPDKNFEVWGIKRFGYSLYHLCFGQYSHRVWGIHPTQLSSRLASSKLHQLDLWDIILKLLGFPGKEQATFWHQFYYPEKGIGELWQGMANTIRNKGGEIYLEHPLEKVILENRRVKEVICGGKSFPCDILISTMPIGALSQKIDSEHFEHLRALGQQVKYVSLISVHLKFKKDKIIDPHWIYLLDPRFTFNRFSEQKNLGSECAPKGFTTLSFELTFGEDDLVQYAPDPVIEKLALEELRKTGLRLDSDYLGCSVVRMDKAYPMYDLEYDKRIDELIEQLSLVENLYLTGRQGMFLNSDMHDSMEMGLRVVREIKKNLHPKEWHAIAKQYVNWKLTRVKS